MKNYKILNKVVLYCANFLRNFPLSFAAIALYFIPEVVSVGDHLSRNYTAFHSIMFLLFGLVATMVPLLFGIILEMKPDRELDDKISWGYLANAIIGLISTVAITTLGILILDNSGVYFVPTPETIAGLIGSIICVSELFYASFLGCINIDSKFCIPAFKIFPSLCGRFHKTGSMVVGTCGLLGTIICSILQNYYNIGIVLVTLITIFITLWVMISKVKMNARLQNKPVHPHEESHEPLIKDIVKNEEEKTDEQIKEIEK